MSEPESAEPPAAAPPAAEAAAPEHPAYRFFVLAMLFLVYTFNFVDRQIIGILAIPIKKELALSDTQLGLLGGIAFALFYTALGVPIALVADRVSRRWIISTALALWSAFTALSGTAGNFTQLFLCRLGVGVGEAGGVAPAYSLLTDYFPPKQRARAIAVYSLGIPLGSSLGVLFGGYVAANFSWRTAFQVVGLAGVVLAPFFAMGVRDPARGRYDQKPAAGAEKPPFRLVLATIAKKPAFWLLSFGAAASSMLSYGLAFWLPAFFQRSLSLDLVGVSRFLGALILVGGLIGVSLGGFLGDKLGQKSRAAYAQLPAGAFLLALPFSLVALTSRSPSLAFALFLVPQVLSLVWLGPTITAIQHLVPPTMRATASAVFLFVNNLLGIGVGTLILGLLSDALATRFGDDALRWSIIIAGAIFYPVATTLFLLASRRLEREWVG